jgi:Bacterial regulatory helix-turn-helix protein, lysR family
MFQPRLEVRHLRMLRVMSRTANITHAAATLCLTQSALSHQIREAESDGSASSSSSAATSGCK